MKDGTAAAAKRRNVGLIVLAQVLALSLWFSGTAAGPGMVREDPAIGADYVALLTSAVQLGFVAGTLVSARMTLRVQDAVTVPANAVSVSQTGNFVFVVEDGKARVQAIVVDRQVGDDSVISSGLKGGETVVTDGQSFLSNGTRVRVQGGRPAPASKPAGT